MKRIVALGCLLAALALALALPGTALAKTVLGRITGYSATSISVLDREVVTFALDERTAYTKLVTQKPWQESTRLNFGALATGRLAAVHVRNDEPFVASWVEVATDMRPVALVLPVAFSLQSAAAPAGTAKAGDLLSAKELKALITSAKTPADHVRLQKHYLALAAKYRAEADEHAADAKAYRDNPSFLASKNPVGPGTAVHCDRMAALARDAAKEAEDMASAHGHMADAVK